MSDELPEGWAEATLGAVASPSSEKVEPSDSPKSRYLSLEHLESETGALLGSGTASDVNSTKAVFHAGDVLYGKLRPYLNKVCIPDFDGICSTDILVFPQRACLDNRLLRHFLSQRSVVEYANHHSTGVQLPRTSFAKLAELPFPLPPLAEQRRIVAQVEALLARVNAARQRLAKAPALLKRFRQSVLAAACSGRLTADWREEQQGLEAGSTLLTRIRTERQKANGKLKTDKSGAKGRGEIPECWAWAKVADLLHFSRAAGYGVLQPGSDLPSGVPMVRVCDIMGDTVLVNQLKRIDPKIDSQYRRTRLEGGEVLVTIVGTIGRTAVAPAAAAGANIARAVAMLPMCPLVVPRYVQLALAEPAKSAELFGLAREVARKTLNLGLLKDAQLPLPPLSEQQEIVRRVEALFKLADAIEKRAAAATARADKLTQAILAKAFRGELVPTEADLARREGRDYEPASVLLERIKAERAAEKGEGAAKKGRVRHSRME